MSAEIELCGGPKDGERLTVADAERPLVFVSDALHLGKASPEEIRDF